MLGRKNEVNCERVPNTCAILDRMPNAIGCRRGQIKFRLTAIINTFFLLRTQTIYLNFFSVMMPETHVWPHTGPTNCRLRMHLGLVVPTTGRGSRLICAGKTRSVITNYPSVILSKLVLLSNCYHILQFSDIGKKEKC